MGGKRKRARRGGYAGSSYPSGAINTGCVNCVLMVDGLTTEKASHRTALRVIASSHSVSFVIIASHRVVQRRDVLLCHLVAVLLERLQRRDVMLTHNAT